jgi:hypothetical protein
MITMLRVQRPNGTVGSTTVRIRLRTPPTPVICLASYQVGGAQVDSDRLRRA